MVWRSPTKPWDLCTPERQELLTQAWGAGNLRWKLDPSQQRIYDDIAVSHTKAQSAFERIYAMDVSRQSGKDFLMSVIAIEQCLRRKGQQTRIPYAAPTKDTVHELLVPTIESIFQDCPPDLLPREIKRGTFRTNAKELNWPWGARIVLVGVDLHPDWLRGPATYAFMVTEPAFIGNFQELMEGVLLPQLLTMPEGFVILASTPPVTPGHCWSTKYIPEAKERGMYSKRVIDDCPRLTPEQVRGAIKELGGRKSTRVRRELYCEHIIESTLAAVPEFQDVRDVVVTVEGFNTPPQYRDTIVAIDPGFSHATGGLFAYLDFSKQVVMIEGDFATQFLNSREVAHFLWAREWQLWGREPTKPGRMSEASWQDELHQIRARMYEGLEVRARPVQSYRDGQILTTTYARWSDTDSRLIADMAAEFGINISPTDKDNSDAALSSFRVNMQTLKYRIHPRCVKLIAHLEQGTLNKSRTKLAESADGGHFDCIPAAVYLNRNLPWGRNPNPPITYSRQTHHVPRTVSGQPSTVKAIQGIFGKQD